MVKEGDPNSVDAPIVLENKRDAPSEHCSKRPPSIKNKKTIVAEHFIFKVARRNLLIVDGVTIKYSEFPPDCYGKVKWDGLFKDGTLSRMRLYITEYQNDHLEPVADYLYFSYRIYHSKFQIHIISCSNYEEVVAVNYAQLT